MGEGDHGSSGSVVIVGIVIAILLAILVVTLGVYFIARHQRKKKRREAKLDSSPTYSSEFFIDTQL